MAIAGGPVLRSGRGPASSLLIGIGNPLRGDDGAAPWLVETWGRRRAWREAARRGACAAEAVGSDRSARLRLRVVDQLLPELAEELAVVRRVLFVDAWCVASGAGLPDRGATGARPAGGEPIRRGPQGSQPERSEPQWSGPRLLPIAAAVQQAPGGAGWGLSGWTPGHHLTPSVLLQLTADLYGRAPAADGLLIPATAFAATDPCGGPACFSAGLRRELPRAWQLLDHWHQEGENDPEASIASPR